jgi:hypothetical protein
MSDSAMSVLQHLQLFEKLLLASGYVIASENQPRVYETEIEGYRPISRLFNIIRIQPVEKYLVIQLIAKHAADTFLL